MGKLKPSQHSSQSTTNSFRKGKLVFERKTKTSFAYNWWTSCCPQRKQIRTQLHKSTLTQQAKLGSDLQIGNMSEPISEGAKLRNFGLFGFCNRVQLKFAYIIHQYAHQNTPEYTRMHTRIHQNAHIIHLELWSCREHYEAPTIEHQVQSWSTTGVAESHFSLSEGQP